MACDRNCHDSEHFLQRNKSGRNPSYFGSFPIDEQGGERLPADLAEVAQAASHRMTQHDPRPRGRQRSVANEGEAQMHRAERASDVVAGRRL